MKGSRVVRIPLGSPAGEKMGVVEKCLDYQARSLQPLSQVCVADKRLPQRAKRHNGTEVCRPSDKTLYH